jgi:DNA-binding NarL/FixJ family response regulator
MIRIVVADDQPLVRMGLRTLVEAEDDIELVGEAADGEQAVALVRQTVPDVVLMDIRMPGNDGLAALRAITGDPGLASVRVVMLTTFEHDEYIFQALHNGASGFLLKDAEPTELLHALRVVSNGGSLLAPSVTRRVIEQFATRPASTRVPRVDLARLTEREREILGWVGTGRSNEEIAAALVVSPATVRTHVGRAMVKLNARDRAQLVVFAVQSGLAIPD